MAAQRSILFTALMGWPGIAPWTEEPGGLRSTGSQTDTAERLSTGTHWVSPAGSAPSAPSLFVSDSHAEAST